MMLIIIFKHLKGNHINLIKLYIFLGFAFYNDILQIVAWILLVHAFRI